MATELLTLDHRQTEKPGSALIWRWGMVILVGAFAMTATFPGRTHGLGTITEPLLRDLGLADPEGRVFYSWLNFWGTLLGALFCLPVGWMFERYDRRWILAGNLFLLGLAVVWMSYAESWQELFVTLLLTRGFGQAALSVVSITIVAKSFSARQLGLAMAVYAILSVPFAALFFQGAKTALQILGNDWRVFWYMIGCIIIGSTISATFISRDSTPQDPAKGIPHETGYSFWQALATPAFWVFSLTISLWGMIYAGVALFNVDIFKERGFDQNLYFNVFTMTTVIGLASKLFFGWLVNYVLLTRLLAMCLLATSVSLIGLPFATEIWHAYAYGVGLGIASGAVALLFFATWGKLYGQRELGRIQSFAQMLTVFASASGPLLISFAKYLTSSYTMIFQLMAVFVFVMALIAWFTPLPRPLESLEHSS